MTLTDLQGAVDGLVKQGFGPGELAFRLEYADGKATAITVQATEPGNPEERKDLMKMDWAV